MAKWIVTGASGSLASECIEVLLAQGKSIHAYARKEVHNEEISFTKVTDYRKINFDTSDCEGLLVCQGSFVFEQLESMTTSTISETIEANFLSQVHVVHSFLQQIGRNGRINIVILGSTNAYEAGNGTVIYGAAKAGILAFVKALNNEYATTDIRFSLVSTGTLANEMGGKVPNQDPTSLLDVCNVAREIVNVITNESNLWQPEVIIRRRQIKLMN
jgi:short-subunit dehydrogenase